jgi:hypothetical protein
VWGWSWESYCEENGAPEEKIIKNNYVKMLEGKRDKNNDLRCRMKQKGEARRTKTSSESCWDVWWVISNHERT